MRVSRVTRQLLQEVIGAREDVSGSLMLLLAEARVGGAALGNREEKRHLREEPVDALQILVAHGSPTPSDPLTQLLILRLTENVQLHHKWLHEALKLLVEPQPPSVPLLHHRLPLDAIDPNPEGFNGGPAELQAFFHTALRLDHPLCIRVRSFLDPLRLKRLHLLTVCSGVQLLPPAVILLDAFLLLPSCVLHLRHFAVDQVAQGFLGDGEDFAHLRHKLPRVVAHDLLPGLPATVDVLPDVVQHVTVLVAADDALF
mmetsp:Transcript_19226/g.63535  ORF Transcript_19226/g.63535 Transcript_19226/m.63535 type:complete len:257 (-) Transcript_19226:1322-2092(-)